MTQQLLQWLKEAGAAQCGALSYDILAPDLSQRAQHRVQRLCPGAKSVLVAAFPYFSGERAGNLSVYARGLDYHLALTRRLSAACGRMKADWPAWSFVPGTDASPLPEVRAALLAGLGMRGEHGLLLCPPYGSYVFLGTVLTDLPLKTEPQPERRCCGCFSCVRACPSGALSLVNGAVQWDGSRCLSDLTQKKKQLTLEEERQLARHPYAWGCDLCQNACPENQRAETTTLPELLGKTPEAPYLPHITEHLLEGLTEEQFQEKFENRAFAWRGLAVLKRNLALQAHKTPENGKS